jgi:hypothetical protein
MRHGIVNDGGTNSNGRFVVCLCRRRRSIISIIQAIRTDIIHVVVVVVVVSGRSHGRKVRESVSILVQQQKNERKKERKKRKNESSTSRGFTIVGMECRYNNTQGECESVMNRQQTSHRSCI